MKSLEEIKIESAKEEQLRKDMAEHSEEYCKNRILNSEYLWDLRAWKNDHDREEVTAYLADLMMSKAGWKGDGHAGFCAKLLIQGYGWKINDVAELVLQNRNVTYPEARGSGYFCQQCGKSFSAASIIVSCVECIEVEWEGKPDHNRFNLIKNRLGEFGWEKDECREHGKE
jgi:hypothetical protein